LLAWLPSVRPILSSESKSNKLERKGEGAFFDPTFRTPRMVIHGIS
jgi:hypothetical protein